jgi:proline iminopeptidase
MSSRNTSGAQEGFINVPGGRVWYQICGGDRKDVPLLVLHGGPGASCDYLEPLSALADQRPVIFYDQLGCGNADKPDDTTLWTIERFVDELHHVRETLGLDAVHLLGQSWGTSLAVEYLLRKESKGVKRLILSGPLLSTSRWIEDQKAYITELPEAIQQVILKTEETGKYNAPEYQNAMMQYYKLHVCRLEEWPACLNRAFAKLNVSLYEYMWGPSEFTVTGTLKNYDRVNRLNEISIPVLFTCGNFDEATPATVKGYQERLPGAELHIFEDASHEHHLEKTQNYLEIVRAFLNRN